MAQPVVALLLALQITAPDIPAKTVHHAESVAAFIFAQAGVSVSWSDRGVYRIQIMNSQPRNHSRDAAGFAVLTPADSGYAAISYAAVEQTANSLGADPGDLLGATIAHEVGHLLLGPAHSQTGVMRAHFGARELEMVGRGELLFDAGQAARIRLRISNNMPAKLPSSNAKELGSGVATDDVIVTVHPTQGGSDCGPDELNTKKAPEAPAGGALGVAGRNTVLLPVVAQN